MFDRLLSVRLGVVLVLLLSVTACAPAAPATPTAPPPKPTAQQPVAKPTEKPAAAPTAAEKVAAKPTEKPASKAAFDEKAVADFYRGKTVRIIVGASPGGGYDTYSRLIAKHMGKYIPGNPTVIVENMPGAGSIVAANHIYSAAPKDGTVIGNIFGTLVLEQLFQTKGVEFDMGKFHYLGVPAAEIYLVILPKKVGVTKMEDIMGPNGKQVVMGGITGSTVEHAPLLLHNVFGANIKVVTGYAGTAKIRLAIDSGEVDGFVNSWQSVKITNREDVESGRWVVLLQLTDKPLPDLPGKVPTILDFAKTEEQRRILLFGTNYPNVFGKPYVVAPEVPADRVAALTEAFQKSMADKELLADAEKSKLEIAPVSGSEAKRLVVETLAMPAKIKETLQKVMKPQG